MAIRTSGLKRPCSYSMAAVAMVAIMCCSPFRKAPADSDFRFEYTHMLGYGEVLERLNIEGHQAVLIRERSKSESAGESIGYFRDEINTEMIKRLIPLISSAKLMMTSAPAPDAENLSFILQTGGKQERLLVPCDPASLAQIADLAHEVEDIRNQLLAKPFRTLRVELVPPSEEPRVGQLFALNVKLFNTGVQPIRLTSRWTLLRAEVALPSTQEHSASITGLPVVWDSLGVAIPETDTAIIENGKSLDLRVPVMIRSEGRVQVRVRFESREEVDVRSAAISGSALTDIIVLNVRR